MTLIDVKAFRAQLTHISSISFVLQDRKKKEMKERSIFFYFKTCNILNGNQNDSIVHEISNDIERHYING